MRYITMIPLKLYFSRLQKQHNKDREESLRNDIFKEIEEK